MKAIKFIGLITTYVVLVILILQFQKSVLSPMSPVYQSNILFVMEDINYIFMGVATGVLLCKNVKVVKGKLNILVAICLLIVPFMYILFMSVSMKVPYLLNSDVMYYIVRSSEVALGIWITLNVVRIIENKYCMKKRKS